MIRLICILFYLFICIPDNCYSQRKTIFGYVQDSLSGERLSGVNIIFDNNTQTVTTNTYGFFTLVLHSPLSNDITFSHVGYFEKLIKVDLNEHELLVKMTPDISSEDEVIITSSENRISTNSLGQLKLSGALLKKMPKFLGDNDPLKVMQTLPGISQGMEGTTGLIVRGGSPDQNLFLLDGTPIYNPTHLGGIFSPFNGDAIKNITIYKGNFPARFGERLSSVIDFTTKDGNMKQLSGEGSVGMLASKLLLEGPIEKDKSSFMISARRTYWDLLASPLIALTNTKEEKRKLNLYFYDVNAKLNYIISPKDRIYGSFFSSNDNYRFFTISNYMGGTYSDENVARMGWQNNAASLRWNHVFSSSLFANATLYATSYKILTDYSNHATDNGINKVEEGRYRSHVNDYGLRTDFEYKPSNAHSLMFGFQGSYKMFQPGSSSRRTSSDGDLIYNNTTENGKQKSPEVAVYAEDNITFSEKLNTNLGLRASMFNAGKMWYKSLEPRLSLNYLPIKNIRFSLSFSQMRQYIHLLANNSVSLPTDIWVPATENIKPISSKQYAFGISTSLADNDLDLSMELFYKTYNGIVEYLDGESYLSSSAKDWQTVVDVGKGKAYGIELFLQKKWGRSTGWASYTFSRSVREFPLINSNKSFSFKYDRPHVANIVYMYRLSQRWKFSANWTFQSGAPFTLETSRFRTSAQSTPHQNHYYFYTTADYISGRNAFRLLDYHRLDVGFNWSKKKKNFEKYWDFSFYNVYNRMNPMVYYYGNNIMTNTTVLKGTGLLPVLPSISYGFKF